VTPAQVPQQPVDVAAEPLVMVFKPGKCRYCGCTDENGCACLCWWIDGQDTVCSAPKCVEFYFAEMRAEFKRALTKLEVEVLTTGTHGGRA